MFDYAFFALLFLLAQSLAPEGSTTVTLENVRHPEQSMQWVRGGDGRWAMTINERDMGQWERTETEIVHHTGVGTPDHYTIANLAQPRDLRAASSRVRLAGQFAPRIVDVTGEARARVLTDASHELLRTPLRLRSR